MKTRFLVMLLLVCGLSQGAEAREDQRARYDEFFTVVEPRALDANESSSQEQSSLELQAPMEVLWAQVRERAAQGIRVFSLLRFHHHAETYGNVVEPYNRLKHFGTWIVVDPQAPCGNVRADVLRRDSRIPVTMNSSGCTVARGLWDEPYTGRTYTEARDLQIDHFVPLKNAYVSGADKWTAKKRCLYSNYMGNKFHLIPVFGKENTKKSDRSPEGYMPPHRAYQCQYLAQWLKVKMIWGLALTPPEKDAIEVLAQENHCTLADMSYTQEELSQQKRFIRDNMNLCH